MKSLTNYIIEGNAPKKISATGKKKVIKYVDNLIKHLDNIWDYAGIPADDDEQVDSDCKDTVWNWADDNNICSMWTKDDDSINFITNEYKRLSDAICNKYNL